MAASQLSFACISNVRLIIEMTIGSLCILIVSYIIFISLKEFRKLKKLQSLIKFSHYVCCISSILAIASGIFFAPIGCSENGDHYIHDLVLSIYFAVYLVLLKSELHILLLRLNYTFRESVYKLTSMQHRILLILVILEIIFSVSTIAIFTTYNFHTGPSRKLQTKYYIMQISQAIGAISYVITTITGMYLFASKLMILIDLRATSIKNVVDINHEHEQVDIHLNTSQERLLNQTSRYVSLISIALISSFVTFSIFLLWYEFIAMRIICHIDCAINVICLHLQYPFATKSYNKYCGCINKCLNVILSRRTRGNMEKKYLDSIHMQELKARTTSHTDNDDKVNQYEMAPMACEICII